MNLEFPITQTHIRAPGRRKEILSRPRLHDLLDELLDYRLIILAAPAGYGKTSLLVDQAAQQTELPFCWYSLDSLDGDLYRFAAHWIAAIGLLFPEFGERGKLVFSRAVEQNLPAEQLAPLIANQVFETVWDHFVLVLDDYHLVADNPEISLFVSRFLHSAGENFHLIISSRTIISIPDLPLMVARSEVSGLGRDDLAFRPEEIQELLFQNYNLILPTPDADELVRETEGWITALLLSAQTMWTGMADRLRAARVSGVGLYEYLAQQILDQQPQPLRDFLLRTSLFAEFNPELCSQALGEPPRGESWQGLFALALKNNLFVIPVNAQGDWVRYHHLFQSFLQARLLQTQPEEHARLLRTLAEISAAHGEWEQAYARFLQLGDMDTLASLVEQAAAFLEETGQVRLLATWIDALPHEILKARPILLARRGAAAAALGESELGIALLSDAVRAFQLTQDELHLASALALRAHVYQVRGEHQASLADANEVIRLTDGSSNPTMARVNAEGWRVVGLSRKGLGQSKDALPALIRSLVAFQSLGDQRSAARVSLALGAACIYAGNFGQALAYYQPALAYFRSANDIYALPAVLNDLGFLHANRGEFIKANDLFEEALEMARQSGNSHIEAVALASLGDMYADLGQVEAAGTAYLRAGEIAQRTRYSFLQVYLTIARAALARKQRNLPEARRLLELANDSILQPVSKYTQAIYTAEAGRLALAEGRLDQARSLLLQAASELNEVDQKLESGRARLALADACYQAGDHPAASENLELAFQLVADLDSPYSLVIAAQEADELVQAAQRLPHLAGQGARLAEQVQLFVAQIPAVRRHLRAQPTAVPLAAPRLQIRALGRAEVKVDGQVITSAAWRSQTSRDLFFLVLSQPGGLGRETLGEALWPGCTLSQLKLRFKTTLYRLRRALKQEAVLFDGERYVFNQYLDYELDVETFLEKNELARAATEPDIAKQYLSDAFQTYSGPYLPDVSGVWVLSERERLHRIFTDAGLELARSYLGSNQPAPAILVCARLLEEEPCLEEAHRLSMRAHAALGNRAQMAQQYQQCCQLLKEEIGVEPSTQTVELYKFLSR